LRRRDASKDKNEERLSFLSASPREMKMKAAIESHFYYFAPQNNKMRIEELFSFLSRRRERNENKDVILFISRREMIK